MIEKLKSKLFNSPEWVISFCVFFVYWFVNRSFTGPAYLSDEIGYLANAALISGYVIDAANSWHAGYSFFLAPLFFFLSEPYHIWQALMVLNALIWSLSFLLLAHLLRSVVPEYDKKHLFFALLISAVYPTWITMSGYAFATTAYVFVYLVALLTFLHWKPNNIISIIPHCFAVGYLYWVHPVGLAVCVASLIVIGIVSIKEKKYVPFILSALITIGFIIFHDQFITKWLIETATPEGYNPYSQHYPDSERLLSKIFQDEFWMHLIAKTAGQISYLVVSSFGLILFGFIWSVKKARGLLQVKVVSNSYEINIKKQALYALMALSLLGIIAIGAIFFSGSPSRFDQWIYGRYTEMVVLPLFAIGILTHWRKIWLYMGALFVFISGLVLYQFADMAAENNIVNTVAFWPQYFRWENNYLYWMTASALVLVLVGRVWNDSRLGNLLVILLALACFFSSARGSRLFHQTMISTFSQPSYLEEVIRNNFEPGTCVGLNPQGTPMHFLSQMQRHHFHYFYFYDYSYRRMSPDEWLQDCNGPYFTYQLDDIYEQPGIKLIGKEVLTGIYLLVKEDEYADNEADMSVPEGRTYIASGWSIDYTMGYYDDQLEDLIGPNGYFEDGSIYSYEKGGCITSGPSLMLGLGQYHFELKGDVPNANDAWVKIVSLGGNTEHGRLNIGNNKSGEKVIAKGYFQLHELVSDLEILVYAGSADIIRIDGYEIEYIAEEEN